MRVFDAKITGFGEAVTALKTEERAWRSAGPMRVLAAAERLREIAVGVATRQVRAGMSHSPPLAFQFNAENVPASIRVTPMVGAADPTYIVVVDGALAAVLRFFEYGSAVHDFNPIPMWRTSFPAGAGGFLDEVIGGQG